MHIKTIITLLLIIPALLLTSCSQEQAADKAVVTVEKANPGIPVEVMVIKKQITQQQLSLSSVIQPIHKVDIVSEVSGKVEHIQKDLGEFIRTKDTLAFIDHEIPYSQYRQAQAQFLSAKNNLQIAKLNLESDKLLFDNADISKLAFQNSRLALKNAEANLLSAESGLTIAKKGYNDTRITSPFAGQISRSYIDLGQMVQPGQALYQVVDLSTLIIEVGLPQDAIGMVKRNNQAQISISALTGQTFKGKVQFISPQADERSGTFTAELHIPNSKDSGIRAGMTAKVTLFLSDPQPMITVPDEALIKHNGSADIYRIENGIANLVSVKTSGNRGAQAVITEGLAEGDTIVTVGQKQLGTNSKVWIEVVH